jgi:phosphomannomutase
MITDKIFKAYDIRGIVPDELDTQTAFELGTAMAVTQDVETIAVGRDMRVSSDELFEAITRGLVGQGVHVVDVGRCSTDALYFAVGKYEYDGGVMITASHNPA